MDCAEARRVLWPPERLRLAGDDVVAAQRHVEACADCQRAAGVDAALLEVFERLRAEQAPRAVRERVFDAIARERAGAGVAWNEAVDRPGPRRLRRAVAAALVLITVAAGALSVLIRDDAALPGSVDDAAAVTAFVDDYVRRAVREDHVVTSDPAEVRRFLARELGLPVGPILVPGFTIAGAEVCLLEGRRGAMILYKRNGDVVSYYVVPRSDSRAREPAARESAPAGLGAGTTVVTWATTSLEHALVGPLESDRMLQVARSTLVPQQ